MAGWPGRVAVAVVRGDPPEVYLAEDATVLSRVLAVRVVARLHPRDASPDVIERIREALLEERWGDAVGEWIALTDEPVDAYPDEVVVSADELDDDAASFAIRMAPIFEQGGRT
jgi:hypothetical protein